MYLCRKLIGVVNDVFPVILPLSRGYDNNVCPYSSQSEHVCKCSSVPVCLTGLNHRGVGNNVATMICLMQDGATALCVASYSGAI